MAKVKVVRAEDGKIHMLDAAGVPVRVGEAEVGVALQKGYQIETADSVGHREKVAERSTLGQQALTGVEGVGRGLTFGLSDVAIAGLGGDEAAQAALERQQVNPGVAMGGELAGAVAPLLLSGGSSAGVTGASLAGRAGRVVGALPRGVAALGRGAEAATVSGLRGLGMVGEGAAARAFTKGASLGAAGAVEGAFYGAGQELSRLSLQREDITAEKLLAGAQGGALTGLFAGGALGAFGSVAGSGLRSVGRRLRPSLEGLAEESAVKALGARGTDLRRLGSDEKVRKLGRDILDYRMADGEQLLRGGMKADDLVQRVERAHAEVADELAAFRARVDEVAQANGVAPDATALLRRIDAEVVAPLASSKVASVRARGDRVARELSALREGVEAGEQFTIPQMEAIRRDLADVVYPKAPKGGGLPPQAPEHAADLLRAERFMADTIEEATEQAVSVMGDPKLSGSFAALKGRYSTMRAARDIVRKADLQDLGNRFVSPSDYATGLAAGIGSLATGNLPGLAIGAGGALAHKLIRERGRSVVARAADALAKLEQRTDRAVARLVGKDPKRLLVPGITEVQDTADKLERAKPPEVRGVSLPALQADAASEQRADETFASLRQRIQDLTDPAKAEEILGPALGEMAAENPTLALAMQKHVMDSAAYLQTKLPPVLSRADVTLTPQATNGRVPAAMARKFVEYYQGVNRPGETVDMLADGKLPRERIEALRDRYPELYAEVRQKVMLAAADRGDELPYKRRVLLGLAFEFTADRSLKPENLASIQATFAPPADTSKPGPAPQADISPKLAADLQTDTQRIASGA